MENQDRGAGQLYARAGIVAFALLAPLLFLCWRAVVDPGVHYLAAHPGAEWIGLRLPSTFGARDEDSYAPVVRFSRKFVLHRVPAKARIELRAMRESRVRVNDVEVLAQGNPADWKALQSIAVGHALQIGSNLIEVRVGCEGGPPSLWLRVIDLPEELSSGSDWKIEAKGMASHPAALATDRFAQPFEEEAAGALAAAGRMAGVLAGLFLVSSLVFAMRARLAGWVHTRLSGPAQTRLNAPNAVTLIAGLAWLAVAIASALRIPQPFGPDVMGHVQYLDWITEKGALPLATDGWSTYHPPFFYVLSALIRGLCGGASWALKLLPFAAGLGQVLLARWVATRVFPGQLAVQAVAIAFAAAIPMNLYVAQFFTNEGLAGFLIGCTICQAIAVTARDTYTRRELAWLGLFAGLALLTKYSALVAVVAVVAVLAVHQLGRRRPMTEVALSLGVVSFVALLVAGGFYVRNFVLLGSVFPGNWEFEWWQDPGFHTFEYWTRIGGWLSNPFGVGLNSFPDSLYTTFFGDAMLGGDDPATGVGFHRDLVAAVMLIGLPVLPLLALGAAKATAQIVRSGSAVWSLVMAPTFGLFLLVAYACSTHPYYSVAKSFFALGAVVPLALLFAAGFELLDQFSAARAAALRILLYGWLGMFAGGVFLAYWI